MMHISFDALLETSGEIGYVHRVTPPLFYVRGLPNVLLQEMVMVETGDIAIVTALGENDVEALAFSSRNVRVGARVARSGKELHIPVGTELLGRSVNARVESLDPVSPMPEMRESRPVDPPPPEVRSRVRIKHACETGYAMIDLVMPIGKGQRELLIGDQKTGKTTVLLRTIMAQVRAGAVAIYAVIGKSRRLTKEVEETLRRMKVFHECVIVSAGADEPAGMRYLAPYTAMTIAEYFRDYGRDVLIVLDDMTNHAKSCREISLIGRRFPGRNSYPGDIFSIHARILERAGNFMGKEGERAITCLPVVEAAQGDITGYITTNLMAMTDGHLYFDYALFSEGRRPALSPFLSVTRVGHQTQRPLAREIGKELLSFLHRAERMKTFATIAVESQPLIHSTLREANQIAVLFDQTSYEHVPLNVQMLLYGFIRSGAWHGKPPDVLDAAKSRVVELYSSNRRFRARADVVTAQSETVEELIKNIRLLGEFHL